MADDGKQLSAVYVSWTTMKAALEQLSQGIHSKLDRSVFSGMAWSIQNQLFAGLKFLGLMTNDSDPTPALEDLVSGDEQQRKVKLKAILMDRYADLFALDLTKTTPHQLSQKMGELYHVNGDTREKAVRFFLSAVDYVGLPVSPLFKKGKVNGVSAPRKKRIARVKADTAQQETPEVNGRAVGEGTIRSVALKSGGILTISATMNFLTLNAADRKFVFDLVEKLEEYEKVSA